MRRIDTSMKWADREIEITPEMIEAGVYEARQHPLGAPIEDLVRNVFLAMIIEQQASEPLPPSD